MVFDEFKQKIRLTRAIAGTKGEIKKILQVTIEEVQRQMFKELEGMMFTDGNRFYFLKTNWEAFKDKWYPHQ